MLAGRPLGELAVAVGLQAADLGPVVLGRGGVLGKIAEGAPAVAAEGLGQDQPALRLGEDAGVLFGAGVVDDGQRAVKGVGVVGRVHQDGAVGRVQPLADPVHDGLPLAVSGQAADDGPALGVEPEVSLRVAGGADPLTGLGVAADEAVAVPAEGLDPALVFGQLAVQPLDVRFGPAVAGKLPEDLHGVVELQGHKGGLAVGAQPQAVVPVGVEAGGQAVGAQVVQRELHGPFQVLVDRALVPVGKGDHLVQEGGVARLGHIFVHGGEQPQRVVRPVGRVAGLLDIGEVVGGVLMAGVVGELDQGQPAAVVHLGGQHEADLFAGHFGLQMDDALNILHGIPVAVAVAQAAVDEGRGPGPHKGDEAVVGVPGVEHGVEGRVRGLDLQMAEPAVPLCLQLVHFPGGPGGGVGVALQDGRRLCGGLHPQHERHRPALAGGQLHHTGQSAAAVLVVAVGVAQVPGGDAAGVAVAVVGPQERRLVPAVGGHRRAGQTEEPLGHRLVVYVLALGQGVQVAVDLLGDAVALEQGAADEEGVLQVDLVLLVVAVVGELGVTGQGQAAGAVRLVGHRQGPDLIGLAPGHIVGGLRGDAGIARLHFGVAHAVAALAPVGVQRFCHRLPGGGPVVAAGIVPQIEVAAGLVELVEHIPQDPAVGAGPGKAVASRMVGDDGAVLRRAQIVDPGGRGIGAVDHVFTGGIVKVSVSHKLLPLFDVSVPCLPVFSKGSR